MKLMLKRPSLWNGITCGDCYVHHTQHNTRQTTHTQRKTNNSHGIRHKLHILNNNQNRQNIRKLKINTNCITNKHEEINQLAHTTQHDHITVQETKLITIQCIRVCVHIKYKDKEMFIQKSETISGQSNNNIYIIRNKEGLF